MVRLIKLKRQIRELMSWTHVRSTQFLHNHINAFMFAFGIMILATGLAGVSEAQNINTIKINCAAVILLYLTEGDLGALVMVIAGISTIIASAFGAFRAAHALLVVACASFVLRSLVDIWFSAGLANAPSPQSCQQQLGGGGGGVPG